MVSSWRFLPRLFCALLVLAPGATLPAAEPKLDDLVEQNRQLQQQVRNQQRQIDELRRRLDSLPATPPANPSTLPEPAPREPVPVLRAAREIRLSGEAGLAYFSSGKLGVFPNSEFRVDDARVFVEAPIWENVYFFGGIELVTREANDEFFHVGELYADIEDVFTAGRQRTLNLRVGRFYLPFGEEYQKRNVLDNPLITHSVADIWGIDEGVQAYGTLGSVTYNVAIQNGGHKTLHDFNRDKSVTARLSFAPLPGLKLSASAHRTGKLDAVNDPLSETWFGGLFFRPLGSAATTRSYWADLVQGDAEWSWKTGHFHASAGTAWFDDDSTAADNSRQMHYYSFELVQQIADKLHGAVRYGDIRAAQGYPLGGLGDAGRYFFNPFGPMTTDLHRLSLGFGWRFGPPLVWKVEYSWENGRLTTGAARDDENLLSTELALRF